MKKFKKNGIVIVLGLSLLIGFNMPKSARASHATAPVLGAASTFSILAQTAITGTGTISGDVGLNSTGAGITALTDPMVGGTIYSTDGVAPSTAILPAAVQADALAAFTTGIPAQSSDGAILPALDAQILTPGVYDFGSGLLSGGVLTLDGAGIYILRASSDLTSSGSISFINGARACDLYWRVDTLATINGTSFAGTILAGTGVHFGAGVAFDGRALAVGGDVTLSSGGSISGPSCAGGGGSNQNIAPIFPLINVTKIPSPLALPSGPGSVTFTYVATNIGEVAMSDVWVRDNKCDSVEFIDGDDNDDSMLDLDEAWEYRCTKIVNQTETNIVTAQGSSPNGVVRDTAEATVVVGAPIIPPLIHLVKVPNVFALPAGGGAVTYMYAVTNPGTEPLNNVSITDDKCTGLPGLVFGNPGDLNQNNLLESNETWNFTCQSNLTQTTTNIGTAEGHANGLTVRDSSPATVVVASPMLPTTGTGPDSSILWKILIPAGILVAGLSFYLARKKRTM